MLNINETEESNPDFERINLSNYAYSLEKQKKHVKLTHLSKDLSPIQQKGKRTPQPSASTGKSWKKLNKLIDQNHIIKLDKCSGRQFIIRL